MLRDGESGSGKCRKSLTKVELDKQFEDSEKRNIYTQNNSVNNIQYSSARRRKAN